MRITKKLQIVALAALSLTIARVCSAQSDAPYTEGPVWNVTMVKAKPGMSMIGKGSCCARVNEVCISTCNKSGGCTGKADCTVLKAK